MWRGLKATPLSASVCDGSQRFLADTVAARTTLGVRAPAEGSSELRHARHPERSGHGCNELSLRCRYRLQLLGPGYSARRQMALASHIPASRNSAHSVDDSGRDTRQGGRTAPGDLGRAGSLSGWRCSLESAWRAHSPRIGVSRTRSPELHGCVSRRCSRITLAPDLRALPAGGGALVGRRLARCRRHEAPGCRFSVAGNGDGMGGRCPTGLGRLLWGVPGLEARPDRCDALCCLRRPCRTGSLSPAHPRRAGMGACSLLRCSDNGCPVRVKPGDERSHGPLAAR